MALHRCFQPLLSLYRPVGRRKWPEGVVAGNARAFWNVSLPVLQSPGGLEAFKRLFLAPSGAHITKYNIVKPYKDGVGAPRPARCRKGSM